MVIQGFLLLLLFSCNKNYTGEYTIKIINKSSQDTIFFDTTLIITGINMCITSNVQGKYMINLKDGDTYETTYSFQGIKDSVFYLDWYTNTMIIEYKPKEMVQGDSINVRYDIISL